MAFIVNQIYGNKQYRDIIDSIDNNPNISYDDLLELLNYDTPIISDVSYDNCKSIEELNTFTIYSKELEGKINRLQWTFPYGKYIIAHELDGKILKIYHN